MNPLLTAKSASTLSANQFYDLLKDVELQADGPINKATIKRNNEIISIQDFLTEALKVEVISIFEDQSDPECMNYCIVFDKYGLQSDDLLTKALTIGKGEIEKNYAFNENDDALRRYIVAIIDNVLKDKDKGLVYIPSYYLLNSNQIPERIYDYLSTINNAFFDEYNQYLEIETLEKIVAYFQNIEKDSISLNGDVLTGCVNQIIHKIAKKEFPIFYSLRGESAISVNFAIYHQVSNINEKLTKTWSETKTSRLEVIRDSLDSALNLSSISEIEDAVAVAMDNILDIAREMKGE